MPSFTFLTHVAGLRGIAIILIILFHFTQGNSQYDIFEFKNGFLGVEIFMVLMGYFLILGLSKKREITFIKFITQKISRLLFPLAVTIIFCALIGIAILDFSYLAVMGRTGRSALLGFSNFKLIYDSTNYFSPDASMNCMLHTWYISAALQLFILSYIFSGLLKNGIKFGSLYRFFSLECFLFLFISMLVKIACLSWEYQTLTIPTLPHITHRSPESGNLFPEASYCYSPT